MVIISQDLDEIFGLCDRIAVIAGGRLSPARPVDEVSIEEIGLLMGGSAAAAGGGVGLSAAIARPASEAESRNTGTICRRVFDFIQ